MRHLNIGGSTFHRTVKCPGWIKQAEGKRNPPSAAANEGNLLHDAMELHYKENAAFDGMVGKLNYNGIALTVDHVAGPLTTAKRATEKLLDEYDIDYLLFEPFVEIIPGLAGGSIDVLGISADKKTAVVADYKFGVVAVSPHARQLQFYALAAATDPTTAPHLANVETLVTAIVQPAVEESAQTATHNFRESLEKTRGELDTAIQNPDKLNPGDHCRYCPAAPWCPEAKQQAMSALAISESDASVYSDALTLATALKSWIKAVEDSTLSAALTGAKIPGFKLIRGAARRYWNDQAEKILTEQLGEKAYDKKLVGITSAEKLLGKKAMAELAITDKPPGKLKLASESARGEEVVLTTPAHLVEQVNDALKQTK